MDALIYPLKRMYITQDYTQGNHRAHWDNATTYKDYPIDDSCGDNTRSPMYATVDMKVIRIYGLNSNTTNTIVLETVNEVNTPSGIKKVTITATHLLEEELKNIYVGQIFAKGSIICYEGDDGNATGNHLHITVCTNYRGFYQNNNGKWCFVGEEQYKPEEIFYVDPEFTTILNSQNINWQFIKKYVGTPIEKNEKRDQLEVYADNLHARDKPNGEILGYINKGFYDILDKEQDGMYMWYELEKDLWTEYDSNQATLIPKKRGFIYRFIEWIKKLFKR